MGRMGLHHRTVLYRFVIEIPEETLKGSMPAFSRALAYSAFDLLAYRATRFLFTHIIFRKEQNKISKGSCIIWPECHVSEINFGHDGSLERACFVWKINSQFLTFLPWMFSLTKDLPCFLNIYLPIGLHFSYQCFILPSTSLSVRCTQPPMDTDLDMWLKKLKN